MYCTQLRRVAAALSILAVSGIAGCGSGVELVKVSGVATHEGQPVENLLVVFKPEQGRVSSGTTDAEGEFTLQFTREEEGVVPGKYQVYVQYAPSDMDTQMAIEKRTAKFPPQVRKILAKYGHPDKSPLTFDIQESQEIELKLD